jgi:heme/copper-type cytochrome/quinol oxidase subunit 2
MITLMNSQTVLLVVLAALVGALAAWMTLRLQAPAARVSAAHLEFEMVTGEWKYESPDGQQVIESYRWDPAVLIVPRGSRVTLKIYGVKGSLHTLAIDAFQIQEPVKRGELTTVHFAADRAGIFPIVCLNHPNIATKGPMIGYLIVQ